MLPGHLLEQAGFGIHLFGQYRVLLFLARHQFDQLLIGFNLLVGVLQFGFELVDLGGQLAQLPARVGWRYKRPRFEGRAGFAECLMEPDCQGAGYAQTVQGLFVLGSELMAGAVAFYAQGMEQFGYVGVQADFPVQSEQQIGLSGFIVKRYAAA